MIQALKEKLDSTFDGLDTQATDERRLTVRAPGGAVIDVLRFLRREGYDHLELVSCVDWIGRGEFEIVYVLSSYVDVGDSASVGVPRIFLKTSVPRERPSVPSSIAVFPGAEPYERELHELYGIHFEGHPRLTPLFLEREYETPPFRKDFDTRKYVEDLFGSVPPVGEES